ncbi:MAG TPA: rhomboid family intramembrane serine protease [Solirubrobacteraceae bacterium]
MATCYRHPNRETGVSCSSCGRAICPDCMTPTPVGMRCPECAKQKTQVRNISSVGRSTDTNVTIGLIIVNVVLFIASGQFSFGGASTTSLFNDFALAAGPIAVNDEYYRLVTGGFLHAGLLHIGFNMYLLWVLGQMLEPALGSLRFGLLYAVSLLAGSAGALLTADWNTPTVGASGAVFGLMGVAFFEMRARGIDPWQSGIGPLILFNLVLSFVLSNISIGGHIGGLIGGSIAALVLQQVDRRRLGQAAAIAVLAVLAIGSAAGGFAAATGKCDADTLCSQIKSAS